jgi:hypothetical protein
MRIIIRKSSEDSYWYRSLVGEIFTITHMDEENYYVEPPVGWGRTREYGVAIEDAEVLEEGQLTLF